jgi:hypothetical protein
MTVLFCAATMGFYPGDLSGSAVGESAVEISKADYVALLGKVLAVDEHGYPVLAVEQPPTIGQLVGNERAWRDQLLSMLMGVRDRHRDQLEIEVATTLSGEQFTELLVYMQALRDWPQSADFPDSQHRPITPSWIAEQTQ